MSILKGEELDNFVKTVEEIKEFLGEKTCWYVAIFASHKHAYFKVIDIPAEIKNLLVVDSDDIHSDLFSKLRTKNIKNHFYCWSD